MSNNLPSNPLEVFVGNDVQNNSRSSDFGNPGIQLVTADSETIENWRITNNILWNRDTSLPGSGIGLQKEGLAVNGDLKDCTIKNNDFSRNLYKAIFVGSKTYTDVDFADNKGVKTDASGAASKSDRDTISHGLDLEPSLHEVNVWTKSSSHACPSTVDSTTITVGLNNPNGSAVTTDETIYWSAEAETLR